MCKKIKNFFKTIADLIQIIKYFDSKALDETMMQHDVSQLPIEELMKLQNEALENVRRNAFNEEIRNYD